MHGVELREGCKRGGDYIRSHYVYAAGVGFFLAQAMRLFAFAEWAGSAAPEWSLRNEDGAVPDAGRFAKMCARKNQ